MLGYWEDDGETRYGLVFQAGRHRVRIDLRQDTLLPAREAIALELASHPEVFAVKVEDFLVRERDKWERVGRLSVDVLSFCDRDDAGVAEVSLVTEAGDDTWTCIYRRGAFEGLLEEA